MHFGQRAFQAPSSKNLKSSCGDGRNNTSDVLSLPFARWQRAAARCGGSADKGRLARGEGHLGFHLPLEPDARAIGLRSNPCSTALPFARRLLEIRLIDRVNAPAYRGTHQFGYGPRLDRARSGADPDPRPRWFLYVTDRVARRAGHRARGEDPEGPTNPLSLA